MQSTSITAPTTINPSTKSITLSSTPDKIALTHEWQNQFGCPAPLGCYVNFLHQAIGWQAQVKKHGGLSATERKQLLGGSASSSPSPTIGARLIRVWQGETHQVRIVKEGYFYKDQHWKSLSAIAKAITGTPWSGPVFFGVKKS
jgi:hypothetical protein